jgi:hypothetical protein
VAKTPNPLPVPIELLDASVAKTPSSLPVSKELMDTLLLDDETINKLRAHNADICKFAVLSKDFKDKVRASGAGPLGDVARNAELWQSIVDEARTTGSVATAVDAVFDIQQTLGSVPPGKCSRGR